MINSKAIVVDTLDSALGIAARRRAKIVNADVVAIVNFKTPNQLAKFLQSKKYELMVFSWRRGLLEAMSSSKFQNFIADNRSSTKIGLVVADYLGLDKKFLEQERELINYVDGYWTTNQDLFNRYSSTQGINRPIGILHDIPDYESIRCIRNQSPKLKKIIWVGNSNWGSNYGKRDHKGFHEIIEPVFSKLEKTLPDYAFCIIDSFKNPLNHLSVLKQIAESKIILQASINEGTGLPILEGLGLGVIPISTNVGVASELLKMDFENLLLDRDTLDFEKKILEVVKNQSNDFDKLLEIFECHISKIMLEPMDCHLVSRKSQYGENRRMNNFIKVFLLWNYRNHKLVKSNEN